MRPIKALPTGRGLQDCRLAAITAGFVVAAQTFGNAHPGAAIYEQRCANCHGADGQGQAGAYETPLFGDRSVESLARLIERTMPKGEAEACVGEDARLVAEYIYDEFYSLAARLRKGLTAAPRIELMRLTVPQYQNAVADLLGRFTPNPPSAGAPDEPGLRAEYYQSKGMNKADKLRQERVDTRIEFDFGEGSPADNISADQFTIIWEGALVARETGFYEFRIRTPNGARLYLNSDPPAERRKLRDDSDVAGQAALIDAWVSSGQLREESARVYLMGGRFYPLRLEFFKYQDKAASIQLEWKPPHGVWKVLGGNDIVTAAVPRCFVVKTPFPPDDRSLGYERGTSLSQEWYAAASNAAAETAKEVVDRLPFLLNVQEDDADRTEKLQSFVLDFASAAFRRPLTEDEQHLLQSEFFERAESPDAAVRRAIIFILSSPSFLYIDLTPPNAEPDSFAIATRMSFALWDSIPDATLWTAAADGRLHSIDEVQAQAERMLGDPRARAKMLGFFRHWLELEERDVAKDREMFPEFDEAVIADLRRSLETFVEQVVWSDTSDYRQLLLADYLLLNDRLRKIYQPSDESTPEMQGDFEPVTFAAELRSGVLTHPYLLSALAYHDNTSPIHRGVFLTRNIVGRSLKPPPVAVAFKNDEFDPDLTMREKITQLTRDEACMSCHSVINPLGFALENYDALGRWRTEENQKPVNPISEYITDEGQTLQVQNARDIASFAVSSEAAHRAFVVQLFHHLVKQPPAAYGTETIDELRTAFEQDNFNIQHLTVRIATLAATHGFSENVSSEP